jgi:hypothetical protein
MVWSGALQRRTPVGDTMDNDERDSAFLLGEME